MEVGGSFDEFVVVATRHEPYAYQRRLASDGFPELLRVPTGAGKTQAAVLPWLYRRRFHADGDVRTSTPRWLLFVLPMRVLVEQTKKAIQTWLDALGLADEVGLHVVMGGEGRVASEWWRFPERDAVVVGTLDMLLSRALNRGYGSSRFAWPIDFGLFNSGCQWVFDEVQLMGPALPTSRQLQGLRDQLGSARATVSMWMSATVDERWLATVDRPSVATVVEIDPADRTGPLARRLDAEKIVEQLQLGSDVKAYPRALAAALNKRHQPRTLTIAVINTVARARAVYGELRKGSEAPVVLLHSRFRPADRARQVREALAPVDHTGRGRIVVSTQVIEAGVDVSAATLFTEGAPWASIVQRAGRCNRDGESESAVLLWASPPKPAPYDESEIAAAEEVLRQREGKVVTPSVLGALDVPVAEVVHPVLRRRDLLDLFDTTPDLSGHDVDVSRFIRDADDLDVQIAWRDVPETGPSPEDPTPTRDELCPVPLPELRDQVKKGRRAWRFDHLDAQWVRCTADSLRPGQIVVLRAADGGYDPETGWDPSHKEPVEPVIGEERSPGDEAMGGDPDTVAPTWVTLRQHLEDVEVTVRDLTAALAPDGLSADHVEAAAIAGRLHDLGKVHTVFQASLLRKAAEDERERVKADGPWAKSATSGRLRHERPYFRHELASALALLGDGAGVLDGVAERELVVYLVAAHHGKVRLGIRSLPGESDPDDPDRRVALGIFDGEELPAVDVPGEHVPVSVLDLSVMELGMGDDGRPSWSARMLALRDRADLGPFRLGFLEALVRLSDWRASADPGTKS